MTSPRRRCCPVWLAFGTAAPIGYRKRHAIESAQITRSKTWLSVEQQLHNFGPAHFLSPGAGCRPRLRVRLDGIGAAGEKQLHHLDAAPPAGPTERGALEEVV